MAPEVMMSSNGGGLDNDPNESDIQSDSHHKKSQKSQKSHVSTTQPSRMLRGIEGMDSLHATDLVLELERSVDGYYEYRHGHGNGIAQLLTFFFSL